MYVCMYVLYVCMYVCMYVLYVCMYVCVYVCMYVCMYVCVCMCVCMFVCVYVCMYVCMYVCVYCMYVCTDIEPPRPNHTMNRTIYNTRVCKRNQKPAITGSCWPRPVELRTSKKEFEYYQDCTNEYLQHCRTLSSL